jgi:hypothetical protein
VAADEGGDAVNHELIQALVNLSTATHDAHRAAKQAGREDLIPTLRKLGWSVAGLLAEAARDAANDEVAV